jgi:flagellar hook-associated protein 3 FlgL
MKVSTSYFFDRAAQQVTGAQNRAATTQAQLATGKQLAAPSDDPQQAMVIERLRTALDRQQTLSDNLQTVQRRYQAEESALSGSSDILMRMKELSIQAANGTIGPADRAVISVELKSLREQMLGVVNAQDDQGQSLFAGTRARAPAFTEIDGRVAYTGDQTPVRITSGDQRLQQYNRSGTDVFARVVRETADGPQGVGFFDAIDDLITAVESGSQPDLQRGISEMDLLQQGVSLALAETGADQNNVQSQLDLLDQTILRLKTTLSDVEDLDYTEAVTRMNKQMLSLEAAMSSFAKVSQLNLFDYMR